jgi:hypothetical protein
MRADISLERLIREQQSNILTRELRITTNHRHARENPVSIEMLMPFNTPPPQPRRGNPEPAS